MPLSRTPRLAGTLAACCGLLLLAACEDPSGAGLTVIDFGEADPRSRVVPAEASLDSLTDFTGFVAVPGEEFQQRALVGRAEDPVFGVVRAIGHADFMLPGIVPNDFFLTPIEDGFLELAFDYVYGDTTSTTMIDVYEITEQWTAPLFTADRTLEFDSKRLLATFPVAASDTLVRVPLSEEWILERDSLFRSIGFETNFHGLQFRPHDDSRLVVGFSGRSTFGLVYAAEGAETADTLRLETRAVATGVTRDQSKARGEDLFLLQDNTNTGLSMTFRLDTLDSRALSAGFVRVQLDTLVERPPNFVRPITRTLVLYGMREGSGPEFLAGASFNEEKEEFVFASPVLSFTLQDMALNRSRYDHLTIGFPRSPVSLNVAPILKTPDRSPRAVVLVVPSDS